MRVVQIGAPSGDNYCHMALRGRPRHPGVLTPRERDVFQLLRRRYTNEQIAERLGITLDGAKYHVSSILSKLGVSSRVEASQWRPRETVQSGQRGWSLILALGKAAGLAMAATTIVGAGAFGFGAFFNGPAEESVDDTVRTTIAAAESTFQGGNDLKPPARPSATPTSAPKALSDGLAEGPVPGVDAVFDAGDAESDSSFENDAIISRAPSAVGPTPTLTAGGSTPCANCNPSPAATDNRIATGTPTPTISPTPTATPSPPPDEHETEEPHPTETPESPEPAEPKETPNSTEAPEPTETGGHGASEQ